MFKTVSGWQRMVFSVCLMVLAFVVFGYLYASGLKSTMTGMNKGVLNIIQGVGVILAFGMGAWQFMEGWSQQQLSSKWLTFIGIAIFIAVLFRLPAIFVALSSSNATEADIIGGTDELGVWGQ